MDRLKVFLSYDYKLDEDLKDKVIEASEKLNSFEVYNSTINTNLDTDYKLLVGKRIRECDLVIFLCGENTKNCLSQAAEMSISREEGKDYVLIKRNEKATKPLNSRPYDIFYELSSLEDLIKGVR